MKITVIIKDKSDSFFEALAAMTVEARFTYLARLHSDPYASGVTMKIGSANSFSDRVDLNAMLRNPCTYAYKLEARKGYKLATFEISK